MEQPNFDINDIATKLSIDRERCKQARMEAWDVLTKLIDWDCAPGDNFGFTVNSRPLFTLHFADAEKEMVQAVFMSLHAYYNRKYNEVNSRLIELQYKRDNAGSS